MSRRGLVNAFETIEVAVAEWSRAAKAIIAHGEVEEIEWLVEEIEFLRYVATERQAEADRAVVRALIEGRL